MTTPALCELPVDGSRTCGVTAIGRCCQDGRAFCTSHRAIRLGTPVVDLCAACHTANLQAVPDAGESAGREQRQQRIRSVIDRLRRLGVDPEPRYEFLTWNEPSRIARMFGAKSTPVLRELTPAWVVGRFAWEQRELWNRGSTGHYDTGVTIDGEIVAIGEPPTYHLSEVYELASPSDEYTIITELEAMTDTVERDSHRQ